MTALDLPDPNLDRNHWNQLSQAMPSDGVQALFKTDFACVRRLQKVRWPDGVTCPGCGAANIAQIKARKNYQCRDCRRQFSVTTDTICHRTHLDLMTRFIAAETMIADVRPELPIRTRAPIT